MRYREFGRTGWQVSEVGFGAWAIGSSWGRVTEEDAMDALHTSIDAGVNLIDTADVYGNGRSERLIGRLLRERGERIYVLTKAGRRLVPHTAEGYNRENLAAFMDRSLRNLGVDVLDLVQLHCPPGEVYDSAELFGELDDLVREGKLRHYGVSVETIDEAIRAIRHPNVQSVQIIFNMFRQRPAEEFFALARDSRVAVLARVPLASGLLTGKMDRDSTFSRDDHRNFNRHGQAFDVGETFSGVDFETGLEAVERLRPLVPPGATMTRLALRWILMFEAVTCVIPGAKNRLQAVENAAAPDLEELTRAKMEEIRNIYDEMIRGQVHHRW